MSDFYTFYAPGRLKKTEDRVTADPPRGQHSEQERW